MDYFTLVTGIAGLIGFAIQLFDVFPRFARARNSVVLLLTGVFVGSLLRAFDASQLKVDVTLTLGTSVLLLSGPNYLPQDGTKCLQQMSAQPSVRKA